MTLRRALEQSINVPAVKLLDLIGGSKVVSFAHRCGIRTPLPTWPSIALGSADLTPLELAASYAAIANQGTHIEPYMIERISSPDGQVLEQHFPAAYTATDPSVAYVLTHMLEGVVDRGTAYAINDLPLDLAGKTGTTDDFTDAWFHRAAERRVPQHRVLQRSARRRGQLQGGEGSVRRRHRAGPRIQLPLVHDHHPPVVPAAAVLHPEGGREDAAEGRHLPDPGPPRKPDSGRRRQLSRRAAT